jgi:hypothetical protein
VVFVLTDFTFLFIADFGLPVKENFKCVDESILMSSSTAGAYFLFFYGIFMQLFSLMIWLVFYKVPERHNLFRQFIGGARVDMNSSHIDISISMDEQLIMHSQVTPA